MIAKKLAIAAASAALVLGAFAPMAFAEVTVNNSGAEVNVEAVNLSNTGANSVEASHDGEVESSTVSAGAATSALTVGTQVNTSTVTTNCGCEGDLEINNHDADVSVSAFNVANTGANEVSANDAEVEGSSVTTAGATTSTNVQTVVNTTSVTVTASSDEHGHH